MRGRNMAASWTPPYCTRQQAQKTDTRIDADRRRPRSIRAAAVVERSATAGETALTSQQPSPVGSATEKTACSSCLHRGQAGVLPCESAKKEAMSNHSEATNETQPACAGQTLAGYKCEQRTECRAHAALKRTTETIGFMPMFRDEITGYCKRYRPAE